MQQVKCNGVESIFKNTHLSVLINEIHTILIRVNGFGEG